VSIKVAMLKEHIRSETLKEFLATARRVDGVYEYSFVKQDMLSLVIDN
jgi:hypothetical protein